MTRFGGAAGGVALVEPRTDTLELVGHPVAAQQRPTQLSALDRLRHVFSYRDTKALVAIFFATQVLDAATTAYALQTGRFSEGNPLLGSLVNAQPYVAYVVKLAIVFLVLTTLLLLRLRWRMRRVVLSLFALTSLVAPIANILRVSGHL
jgi:hypothetical protein